MSSGYYDRNAKQFLADVASIDMTALYKPFVERIPKGGWILDAGCGPGRDLLAFKQLGFNAEGFDQSIEMVRLARVHSSAEVSHASFESWVSPRIYNGIWCSASLLHVPHQGQSVILDRLFSQLMPGGVLYCSYKLGTGMRQMGERVFFDHTEESLSALLEAVVKARVLEIWETPDLRPGRESEHWINSICERRGD